MKINNRDFETMQETGYYNTEYAKGDGMYMDGNMPGNYDGFAGYGMGGCCPNQMMGESLPGVVCPPIYECPRETVCHRYIFHEVPQE